MFKEVKDAIDAHGLGLLLLRVGFGGFMAMNHGWAKLLSFGDKSEHFATFLPTPGPANLALAIFGELVCSHFIVIGLGTRIAAVPAALTMLVAALGAHADDITGAGEHALLYAIAFAAIGLLGPGCYSVDALLKQFRARPSPGPSPT
jgi:putative oxidoreductase